MADPASAGLRPGGGEVLAVDAHAAPTRASGHGDGREHLTSVGRREPSHEDALPRLGDEAGQLATVDPQPAHDDATTRGDPGVDDGSRQRRPG